MVTMMRRGVLQSFSLLSLALALAGITYARMSASSLRASVVRVAERVEAYVEQGPGGANVMIPIVFDAQDHALSCEVATLKMVLAYRGVQVQESELIKRVGFDRTPHTYQGGRELWGDPSKAFVGNIDGRMMDDGYGVYWQPIERVAKLYRKEAQGFERRTDWHLVQELQEGNPIIVWGCLGACQRRVWYAPGNENKVFGVSYEHTFIVNGFSGNPDAPDGFWLVDPIYGQRYMERNAFIAMWDSLDRSGVVVY